MMEAFYRSLAVLVARTGIRQENPGASLLPATVRSERLIAFYSALIFMIRVQLCLYAVFITSENLICTVRCVNACLVVGPFSILVFIFFRIIRIVNVFMVAGIFPSLRNADAR